MQITFLTFITLLFKSVLMAKLEDTIAIYPKGSDILLKCYKEDAQDKLIWTTSEGNILFNDDDRYSKEAKYNNFEVEISGNRSTIIITHADLDDEGEYFCSDSRGKEMVNVSIEVSPTLEMKINGIIETSLLPNTSITCSAFGARPAASIRIRIGTGDWLMTENTERSPTGLLWDTIATFYISLPIETTGKSVTCQTFGQITVERINATQNLSSPACIIQYNTLEVSCNCTSNPPANKYLFSIDGEANVTGSTLGTLSVENKVGSEVVCYGLSKLGIGKSNVIVVLPTAQTGNYSVSLIIAIFALSMIVVVVLLLIALGTFIRWKRSKKKREFHVEQGTYSPVTGNDEEETKAPDDEEETKAQNDNQPKTSEDEGTKSNENQPKTSDEEETKAQNDNQPKTSGDEGTKSMNENQPKTSGDGEVSEDISPQEVSERVDVKQRVREIETENVKGSVHTKQPKDTTSARKMKLEI